jgi:ribosomal protein L7/L12
MIRNDELPAEVALALQRGNKIEAIKLLRLARRIDLKDAKQIIDGAIGQDPRLHGIRADAADGRRRYVLVLIALALLAFLYHYLTQG